MPKVGDDKNNHWHVAPENSMNVAGFGMTDGKLRVVFDGPRGTSTYQYTQNDKDICCRWEMADSIGKFFHAHVRLLPYARIA